MTDSTNAATVREIERRLGERFAPDALAVIDDSAKHAGHAGAASGGGHFDLRIVSTRFAGSSRVARHRLVYDCLSDLMRHAIHALAIEALTPEEAARTQAPVPTPASAVPPTSATGSSSPQ